MTARIATGVAATAAVVVLVWAAVLTLDYRDGRAERRDAAEFALSAATESAAATVEADLDALREIVDDVANRLMESNLTRPGPDTVAFVETALYREVEKLPKINSVIVAYERFSEGTDQFICSAARIGGQVVTCDPNEETTLDNFNWYIQAKELGPGWTHPRPDSVTGQLRVRYSVPFFSDTGEFAGVVNGTYAMSQLAYDVSWGELGTSGYPVLLSETGQFLSHPDPDLVSDRIAYDGTQCPPRTPSDAIGGSAPCGLEISGLAHGFDATGFREIPIGDLPADSADRRISFTDGLSGRQAWLAYAPVRLGPDDTCSNPLSPCWTFGAVAIQSAVVGRSVAEYRQLVIIGLAILLAAFLAVLAASGAFRGRLRGLWAVSISLSVAATLAIVWVWFLTLTPSSGADTLGTADPRAAEMGGAGAAMEVDDTAPTGLRAFAEQKAEIDRRLRLNAERCRAWLDDPDPDRPSSPDLVPVDDVIYAGVFVQSIELLGSNDVEMSGIVWQEFRDIVTSDAAHPDGDRGPCTLTGTERLPDPGEPGFVFPEAERVTFDEQYREIGDGVAKVGWAFTATLRQRFDYTRYPLDRENAWLRIWPADYGQRVVLLPDAPSYRILAPAEKPGMDAELFVEGWSVDGSFFSVREHSYNTDFGLRSLTDPQPELYFNVLMTRRFLDPVVSNVVPLLVVLLLLFAVLVLTTGHEERKEGSGFQTFGALSFNAALFFVLIFTHIQLRNSLAAPRLLYLEWYYLVAYVALLGVSANAIFVPQQRGGRLIQHADNVIPALLFWPFITLSLLAVTLISFY